VSRKQIVGLALMLPLVVVALGGLVFVLLRVFASDSLAGSCLVAFLMFWVGFGILLTTEARK